MKKGDRVKVEYEGTVTLDPDNVGDLMVGNATAQGLAQYVWAKHCTLIVPVYVPQVGDVVRIGSSMAVHCITEVSAKEKAAKTTSGTWWGFEHLTFYARPEAPNES